MKMFLHRGSPHILHFEESYMYKTLGTSSSNLTWWNFAKRGSNRFCQRATSFEFPSSPHELSLMSIEICATTSVLISSFKKRPKEGNQGRKKRLTWILWWHTLLVRRTGFPPRRHLAARWPAFLASRRSGNSIWWPRSSSDGDRSSTRCGRGRNTGFFWTDRPATCPGIDWGYVFGFHIGVHRPVKENQATLKWALKVRVSISNATFIFCGVWSNQRKSLKPFLFVLLWSIEKTELWSKLIT